MPASPSRSFGPSGKGSRKRLLGLLGGAANDNKGLSKGAAANVNLKPWPDIKPLGRSRGSPLPKIGGAIGIGLYAADAYETWQLFHPEWIGMFQPNGWTKILDCPASKGPPTNFVSLFGAPSCPTPPCTTGGCLTGQNQHGFPWGYITPGAEGTYVHQYGMGYLTVSQAPRWDVVSNWFQPNPGVPGKQPLPWVTPQPIAQAPPVPILSRPIVHYQIDPNILRRLPPRFKDQQQPQPVRRGGEKPSPHPQPARPQRPPRGTKEQKIRSRLSRLLNVLDAISENAEIVDAFFHALPALTQWRWKKRAYRLGLTGRGLLDNAGQYGISGADWKLQAIYRNWDLIDTEKALNNIGNNIVEDQVYGFFHRNLPAQGGGLVKLPTIAPFG